MPATVATPTGALNELMRTNAEYECMGLDGLLAEYTARIRTTIGGSTYWKDLVLLGGSMPSKGRPITMFQTPGFSIRDQGPFHRVAFREFDDPDDLDW